LKNEVLEVRSVDGPLHLARKERKPDERDPRLSLMTPTTDNGIIDE